MFDKEIPLSCILKEHIDIQTVTVNGRVFNNQIKTPYYVCPTCGDLVAQFNAGTSFTEIFQICNDQLKNKINYCTHCGQRLMFPELLELDNIQNAQN